MKVPDELIIMFQEKTILKIRGRTRYGLIASMLESCREPKMKTELLYEVRISYELLGTVLGFCLEASARYIRAMLTQYKLSTTPIFL